MLAKREKNGDYEGEIKEEKQKYQIDLDHITCNGCVGKCHYHYEGNSECYTQTNIRQNVEAFRNMKQEKYDYKPPDGGG